MSPVQQAILNRNKKLVISLGVIALGLWVLLIMYLLGENKKDYSVAKPGVVAVHSASPTIGTAPVSHQTARFRTSYSSHYTISPVDPDHANAPQATMGSTSMHLYQTSDAKVQQVGGGSSREGLFTTSGQTSQRGVQSANYAYSGMIYVATPSNAITAVGAENAAFVSDVVDRGIAPRRVGRDDNIGEAGVTDMPIGDVAWGLMLLLTILWGVRVRLREQ